MLRFFSRLRVTPSPIFATQPASEQLAKNLPDVFVGLPYRSHRIWVCASVSAPSVTSQILSSMADASSNTTRMRLPWLCMPAKPSVFSFDHGIASMRHFFSRTLSSAM